MGEPTIASWLRKKKRMGQYQDCYYELRGGDGEEGVLYEFDGPNANVLETIPIAPDTPILSLPGNDFKIGLPKDFMSNSSDLRSSSSLRSSSALRSSGLGRRMSSKLKGPKYLKLQALSADSKRSWVQALATVSKNSVSLAQDDDDDQYRASEIS